ncbi:hypothetical protein GGI07_001079 [Coemansia sp. Benny D115]|nr:hypothetical protein GGI07_001079 [Coemansia sp. Benny D115]
MVSLTARLKRNSAVRPLSLGMSPTDISAATMSYSTNAQVTASGSITDTTFYSLGSASNSTLRSRNSVLLNQRRGSASDGAVSKEDEILLHGSPVFDAGYWYTKGGMDLVRGKHSLLSQTAEALVISSAPGDSEWQWSCLALGWPGVRIIDISCGTCGVESDPAVARWLYIVQDRVLFPQARLYRLTAHWSGCTEVFEHPLRSGFDVGFSQRLALLEKLPAHIRESETEMRFLKYRLLFLAGVSFKMAAMEKTSPGALAMYTYIMYLLKTDIFMPGFIELTDAQPQHMQRILDTINENPQQLPYQQMRTQTSSTALQASLRCLWLDLHSMVDGRHSIPFCAAHFPGLESLHIEHTPDFKNGRDNPMSLGVVFSLPWNSLTELRLPFVSDHYATLLREKCPSLQFLHICPEPRYERWTMYSQAFTPAGLHQLACKWPTLRQLVVRHAFRQGQSSSPSSSQDHLGHLAPPAAPSRMSFSGSRLGLRGSKANASADLFRCTDSPGTSPGLKIQIPGLQPCETFTIFPRNTCLRVLRLPYLQLPFSAALTMLLDIPQLRILEFAPLLSDPEPQPTGLKSTLRRRVSTPANHNLNAPFADSETVYQLLRMKHPLRNMILHESCTTRYISNSWIQIMNSFLSLDEVTFVATKQEDVVAASRVKAFCAENEAAFSVQVDDQSRSYQTCIDFTNSWEKMGKLVWNK